MKNPLNNISIYRVYKKDETKNMIVIRYGESGTVRAFDGYGERVLGVARGYGYDKINTALQNAIERLYSVTLESNGAAGFSNVQAGAAAQGITVEGFIGAVGFTK